MPKFDVVTVSHENAATIQRYLSHGFAVHDNARLVVVDNASQDGTVNKLQAALADHQIIINADNRGYGIAANQGATAGHQAYIAFINPDCFVDVDAVSSLADYLHKIPEVGMVGCRILNQDGSIQSASCRRLPTFWRVFNHMTGLYRLGFKGINKPADCANQSASVEAVNGALFVIRRDLFERLQGFDEVFPLHFEDLDLMKRCLDAGYQIHYLAELQAIHLKGHSTQHDGMVKQWKRQGLKRYFKKHRPAWEQWMVNRLG